MEQDMEMIDKFGEVNFSNINQIIMDRISHFEYFNWIAGDKMSKEPRLSLLSLANDEMQSVLEDKFSSEELTIYQSLKKNNKLKTSSVGDCLMQLLRCSIYVTLIHMKVKQLFC